MNDSHGQKTRFTLKACRVNKGFTIKEAAKKLGISEFTLMNYELGKTFPTVPVINKIDITLATMILFFYHRITV